MSKKKKETIKDMKDKKFVYCGHFMCPNTHCLKHHIHEPWGIIVYEKKFSPDKDWNCKDMEV